MPAVKKKVLFTSHTANFHKFNRPFMRMLKEQGYEVHYASAGEEKVYDTDKHFDVPFERSPFKFGNLKAYFALKKIIDREGYDLIHTHTPMGSVVTRLAARTARKNGTRVIYTAHGFHFFKGAPLLNWIVYYPIEKYMARHTDTLITINNEDYERAKKKFKTNVEYVPGVGVDLTRFAPPEANEKKLLRAKYGYSNNDFILIYAAELNDNKNQSFLIKQIPELLKSIPNLKLILCGTGDLRKKYLSIIRKFGLESAVHLMGYRKDMNQLLAISDIGVASSIREGLGVNLIEALAAGLPLIATDNRGHREVSVGVFGSNIIAQGDGAAFQHEVMKLYDGTQYKKSVWQNDRRVLERFSINQVSVEMQELYTDTQVRMKSIDTANGITISVVIPAYNADSTIVRSLSSVLEQSAANYIKDVIVVDDGSTDGTAKVVENIMSSHPAGHKIKYLKIKNSGVSKARNLGVKSATGSWIALLDSDDAWAEDKIEMQLRSIHRNNEIRFIGANSEKDLIRHGKKVDANLRKISLMQYMLKSSPSTGSIMFESSLVQETGYFEEAQRYAEDSNLFMKMIHQTGGYYRIERLVIPDNKHTFGARGLSKNLRGMHEGCLKNIDDAYKLGYISLTQLQALKIWEVIRYSRRVALTRFRSLLTPKGVM